MNIDNDEQFKQFASSQEVFNAYKQYMALDDMTMVEFAKNIYPLLASQRQALRDEVLAKWVVEQAVILKAQSTNSPWDLNDEIRHVVEAYERATEAISTIFEGKGDTRLNAITKGEA